MLANPPHAVLLSLWALPMGSSAEIWGHILNGWPPLSEYETLCSPRPALTVSMGLWAPPVSLRLR